MRSLYTVCYTIHLGVYLAIGLGHDLTPNFGRLDSLREPPPEHPKKILPEVRITGY